MNILRKPVRTISGVTPLTVVLKPRKCDHGTCIFCPGGDTTPQSYTDKSPAIMRALRLDFDPYTQVKNRLEVLEKMGHPVEKIEIILLGGTFLQYPKEYKYNFVKRIFDALNSKESKTLDEAKKINETALHKCVALCIENRPDNCTLKDIKEMLEFGCTRVELGIQIPDDAIYKKINRGHTVQDVVDATKQLREAGFKIGYHYMPGLPYSTFENDLKKFRLIFDDEQFKPDQLKIYPCQIVDDAPLSSIYHKIKYVPYTTDQTRTFLREAMEIIPLYCRLMRVMREIPKEKMIGGAIRLDIRKTVEEELREEGVTMNEIRMREIGFNRKELNFDLKLKTHKYRASGGDEYFLEIINNDNILFGLLRLRLSSFGAMVRELHVYGKTLNLGDRDDFAAQHSGLGKWLMDEAEKIVAEKHTSIRVISGVGVRGYYKKLGYHLDKDKIYMEKDF